MIVNSRYHQNVPTFSATYWKAKQFEGVEEKAITTLEKVIKKIQHKKLDKDVDLIFTPFFINQDHIYYRVNVTSLSKGENPYVFTFDDVNIDKPNKLNILDPYTSFPEKIIKPKTLIKEFKKLISEFQKG